MVKAKRIERVAALSKLLADHPYRLFSFSYFCKKFAIAKSTLSEDVLAVKSGLELYGLGKVETVSGAAGGVRFIPGHLPEDDVAFLEELAARLTSPDRILPGGMLYTTDILCHPETVVRLGEIFMLRLQELAPDCIMTVETSGIPLAMQTARAFNVPLVIARHTSDITEGSTVNINYVSGSTKVIQNMAMPKRALQPGSRVLIVEGMIALAHEVGAQVVGKAFLIATAAPERKLVEDYTAFFTLHNVDEEQQKVTLEVNK